MTADQTASPPPSSAPTARRRRNPLHQPQNAPWRAWWRLAKHPFPTSDSSGAREDKPPGGRSSRPPGCPGIAAAEPFVLPVPTGDGIAPGSADGLILRRVRRSGASPGRAAPPRGPSAPWRTGHPSGRARRHHLARGRPDQPQHPPPGRRGGRSGCRHGPLLALPERCLVWYYNTIIIRSCFC